METKTEPEIFNNKKEEITKYDIIPIKNGFLLTLHFYSDKEVFSFKTMEEVLDFIKLNCM